MTSILISSDDLSLAETIAQQVADKRDMPIVNRSYLDHIEKQYNIKTKNLIQLLNFNGRLNNAKKRLLACLEAGVFEKLLDDNIVCTGLGAHLYVTGISHVLNIRVLSDMASATHKMAAEKNMAPKKVRSLLEKKMKRRQRQTRALFGIDETNPATYDMLLTLGKFDIDQVVKTIVETAEKRKFKTMTYSKKCALDLALAGRIRIALDQYWNIGIQVNDSIASLTIGKGFGWKRRAKILRTKAMEVEGVSYVRIRLSTDVDEDTPPKSNGVVA